MLSALVTPLRKTVTPFWWGRIVACNHTGCMTTETTSAQEQLWSDALPDTTVTVDQAWRSLHIGSQQ